MKQKFKISKGPVIMVCALLIFFLSCLLTKSGLVLDKTGQQSIVDRLAKESVKKIMSYVLKEKVGIFQYAEYAPLDHSHMIYFMKSPCIPNITQCFGRTVQPEAEDRSLSSQKGWTGQLIWKDKSEEEDTTVHVIASGNMEELLEENQRKLVASTKETSETKRIRKDNLSKIAKLKSGLDSTYLLKNFYIVDSTTVATQALFNVEKFLEKDFSLKKKDKPQILIYHTHGATESFVDSRKGKKADSVVGVGGYLADILKEKYGYQVIHDETEYDRVNGKIDRNKAYNQALPAIEKILEENPSIEVVIDLHRDGVSNGSRRVTTINGKSTAQLMFFNGLSRNRKGKISYLYNPNLQANLAFGLQMKLKAMELYPDLTIKNYLKAYRYNMHLRERFLLIELGNENSTLEEAKNAMEPLADILHKVLSNQKKER